MARDRGEEEKKEGTASWMMTFSDLSTLLLTFFVLLLSMSSLNDNAFRNAFVNFNKASGILFFRSSEKVNLKRDVMVDDLVKTLNSLYLLEMRDTDETSDAGLSDEEVDMVIFGNAVVMKKHPGEEGFSFVFGEKMLFERGSADLNPLAHPVLQKLGEFLINANYRAYVDGHTDATPVHSEAFDSNESLSIARGMGVLTYLLDQCKVPPKKLALAGYGSSHPIADEATDEGRMKNRRVEIIFRKLKS